MLQGWQMNGEICKNNTFRVKLRIKERYYYSIEIVPLPQSRWFVCEECKERRLAEISVFCDNCYAGVVRVLKVKHRYVLPPTEKERKALCSD